MLNLTKKQNTEVADKKGDKLDGVAQKQEGKLESAGKEVINNKDAELKRSVASPTADIITRGYVHEGLGGGARNVLLRS